MKSVVLSYGLTHTLVVCRQRLDPRNEHHPRGLCQPASLRIFSVVARQTVSSLIRALKGVREREASQPVGLIALVPASVDKTVKRRRDLLLIVVV